MTPLRARRRSAAAGGVLGLCLIMACRAVPPPAPEVPPADPHAALATVRAQEERIRTLRARFSAATRYQGERRSADGVLVVKKPDRFRLRLFMPFGLTIFDYVSWGDMIRVTPFFDAAGRPARRPDDLSGFSHDGLGQAFLRGVHAFPGECVPVAVNATETQVTCRECEGCPPLREITIDPRTSTIREEVLYDARQIGQVLRYDDYRVVDGFTLPYHIVLESAGEDRSVNVTVQRYEVNPELSDELFEPAREP